VTVPDNTILHLHEPFTKTWRIRNSGTCAWTTAYKLMLAGGDALGAPASVPMPKQVDPGQTVDISVTMTAPDAAGRYEGLWRLQTAEGRTFGVGASAEPVWVRVRVVPLPFSSSTPTPSSTATLGPPTPTQTAAPGATPTETPAPESTLEVPYDFAANMCAAQWQSNSGILTCPGQQGDPNGFVLDMNDAHLEDGTTASLATLLTVPQNATDGYILGVYPDFNVQAGDHFQASVGCEQNATDCSVLFRLSYLDQASNPHDLWSLGEFYDGKYYNLDLDLSQLAGQRVKFVLYLSALGSPVGDRALWVAPRIVRFPVPTPTATDTSTATVPASTSTPTVTSTPPAAPTALPPTPVPTAAPGTPGQLPSLQQILDAITSFFQRLFGGK